MSTRERASLIPNANNPRLLLRVLSMVAAGIRRPRALAEILEVEIRTVHYYTQACEWLGLLSFDTEVHLTERGMELAFAEPHKQMELYGQAVWSNGFAQGLLQGRTEMPDRDAIALHLQREPTMSSVTARRVQAQSLVFWNPHSAIAPSNWQIRTATVPAVPGAFDPKLYSPPDCTRRPQCRRGAQSRHLLQNLNALMVSCATGNFGHCWIASVFETRPLVHIPTWRSIGRRHRLKID